MKKHIKFLVVLIVFAFAKQTQAQNYQWDWAKHGGGNQFFSNNFRSYIDYERVLDITVDSNNNYYYSITYDPSNATYDSNSLSGNDGTELYLLSTDCNGNFRWDKEIGSGLTDFGFNVQVDSNNNVYHTGNMRGARSDSATDPFWDTDFNLNSTFGEADPGPHNRSSYIVKYDDQGIFQWIKFPDNGMLNAVDVIFGFQGREMVVESNGTIHWLVSIGLGTHVDGNVTVPNTVDREWKVIRYDTNGVYQGHTDIDYTGGFDNYNINFAYDSLLNRYYFANNDGFTAGLVYRGTTVANNSFIVAIDATTGNDVWLKDDLNALGMVTYYGEIMLTPEVLLGRQ
jgi:hypothetical protein